MLTYHRRINRSHLLKREGAGPFCIGSTFRIQFFQSHCQMRSLYQVKKNYNFILTAFLVYSLKDYGSAKAIPNPLIPLNYQFVLVQNIHFILPLISNYASYLAGDAFQIPSFNIWRQDPAVHNFKWHWSHLNQRDLLGSNCVLLTLINYRYKKELLVAWRELKFHIWKVSN